MILSPRSSRVRASVVRTLRAEAQTFGARAARSSDVTSFPSVQNQRDVVRRRGAHGSAAAAAPPSNSSVNVPAPRSGARRAARSARPASAPPRPPGNACPPRRSAASRAGRSDRTRTRRRDRRGSAAPRSRPRRSPESGRHLRPVVEHDGDAVARADAPRRECCAASATSVRSAR